MRLSIRIIPIAILVTFCFGHMKAQAEFQIDEDLPIGNGESKYVQCAIDNHNNVVSFPWYIPPSERTAGNTIPTSSCLSGNFVLIFEDVVNGTQQGYDGAQGPLMQNVACEVFRYISTVFVIQGAPEVVFRQATNNPQTLTLASGSPLYSNTVLSGFAPCYMETYAQTGSDPDPTSPEGVINTNLAITYNFNYPNTTSSSEVDFFTVLLHEALHVMGHVSLISSNGTSLINGPYSTYDSHIANNSGLHLIDPSGSYFQASINDITSNDAHFDNPTGTEQHSCYNPALYDVNSTLAHFDITRPLGCNRLNYVMHPFISYGTERRRITRAEMELMRDLNYQVALPGNHLLSNYPTSVIDDISLPINQTFSLDVTLNDNDNDGDPRDIDPSLSYIPHVIAGPPTGTVQVVGNTITYIPPLNFIGSVTILYSLHDGTISPTEIDIYNPVCLTITYSATICPDDACNLVCNGTFEDRLDPSCTATTYSPGAFGNNMNAWTDFRGTADILTRHLCAATQAQDYSIPVNAFTDNTSVDTYSPSSYNGLPNNTYVHIGGSTDLSSQTYTEGIAIQLPQPLVATQLYSLSFYAYVINYGPLNTQHLGNIRPGFTQNAPASSATQGPATSYDQDLYGYPGTTSIPLGSWQPVSFQFQATGNYTYFLIENYCDVSEEFYLSIFIDDVQLREVGPQLTVTKTANSYFVTPGQQFAYNITVCNNGPNTANGVTVTDYFPPGISYISGFNNPSNTDHTFPPIPVLGCQSVTVNVEVDANFDPSTSGGLITNCANITAGAPLCQNSTYTGNCFTNVAPYSDILVTKMVDLPSVSTGSIVTYTIAVVNQSPFPSSTVVVSEALPSGLTLVSYNISGNVAATWNGNQLSIPQLVINQPVVLTITAQVTVSNPNATCLEINNCAAVISATYFDPNPANNQACASIYLDGSAPIMSSNAATLCNTSTKVYNLTNPGGNPSTSFFWTVSCGTITSGQGSPNMQADFTGCVNDITITLTITDLISNCGQSISFIEPVCCPITLASNDILVDGNTINDIADLYNAFPSAFASGAPNYVYNYTAGTLYINGTFTINGNISSVTFNPGSEIRLGTNAKIDVLVPGTFDLNLNSTHIASGCGGMWDGIYLTGNNQTINVVGSATQVTLIEDAQNAIVSSNGAKYRCNEAVFNKNYIGILVNGIGGNHPGTIRNTVFTCRDLSATALVMSSFKGNTNINSCQKGELPVGNIVSADLLGQPAGKRSYAGVYIDKVGISNINPNTLAITSWTRITIGFGSGNFNDLNVFDNMDYGVYAVNSNVEIKNNHFQNLTGPATIGRGQGNQFGIGVYGVNDALNVTKKIEVGFNNSSNSFYDCNRGVDLNGYYEATVNNNCFESNQVYDPGSASLSLIGNYAIFVKSGRFINTEIGFNRIVNCAIGIAFFSEYLPVERGAYYRMVGSVHIYENGVVPVTSGTITTQFVTTAIIAQGLSLGCPACNQITPGNLLIEHNGDGQANSGNFITDVFNGIEVIGWPNNVPRISDNLITLRYRANFGPAAFAQFGIRAISNDEPIIYRNVVIGNMLTGNTNSKIQLRGIYLTQNKKPYVRCNSLTDVGQCMVFEGNNIGVVEDNIMNRSTDGLVLMNFGVIGQQGLQISSTTGTASDNEWNGPFLAPNGADTRTDVTSPSSASKLIVRNFAPYFPAVNAGPAATQYVLTVTCIQLLNGGVYPNCNSPQFNINSAGGNNVTLMQNIVGDSTPFGQQPSYGKWNNKHRIYTILESDSLSLAASVELQQFYASEMYGSIGIITRVDSLLLNSNGNGALAANQSYVPSTVPENNFQMVNEIYAHILLEQSVDTIALNTLETVANQCPSEGGIAVFRARALLNVINDDYQYWNDSCIVISSSKLIQSSNSIGTSENSLEIFPNPSEGQFTLRSNEIQTQECTFEILDATGKRVYYEILAQNVNAWDVDLSYLQPGMYFFRFARADGLAESGKIIVTQ